MRPHRRDFLRVMAAAVSTAACEVPVRASEQTRGGNSGGSNVSIDADALNYWTGQFLRSRVVTLGSKNVEDARTPRFFMHTQKDGFRIPTSPPVKVDELEKLDLPTVRFRVVVFTPSEEDSRKFDASQSGTLRVDMQQTGLDSFWQSCSRRRSCVWSGVIQTPKTRNALREIDLPHNLALMLREFIGERKSGFLFRSSTGKPLCQTNVLKRSLYPILETMNHPKTGFHAFRRFRASWLRKNRAPEDLIRFWLGHANQSVTDGYSKLNGDTKFREECTEKIGLGFKIPAPKPDVVPIVPKNEGPARIGQALLNQA